MKEDKIYEVTRKAVDAPREFTDTLLKQSKKLRDPSSRAFKAGTAAGAVTGAGLLLAGTVQFFSSRHTWGLGLLSAGVITLVSNYIACRRSP